MEMTGAGQSPSLLVTVAQALREHSFSTVLCPDSGAALALIDSMAADAQIIGMGGSMTLRNMGVIERLQGQGKTVYTKMLMPKGADFREYGRSLVFSDLFLSSANAVTMDGTIVNVDGSGNRVAAIAFGPRKTLIVVGRNKIVPTLEDAIKRVHELAAPPMCSRLKLKTPCGVTGKCADCNSPDRACRVVEILERCPRFVDITVALVNEDLGY